MSDQWYCRVRGRETGPFTAEQLKALAAQGKLLPDHLVRQGPQGQWATASRIGGLFQRGGANARAAATANSAPTTGAPPTRPPVRSVSSVASGMPPQVNIVAASAAQPDTGAASASDSPAGQPRPKPLGAMLLAFALAIAGLCLIQFPILPLVFGVAAVLLSLRALPSAWRHSVTLRALGLAGLVLSLSVCCIGGYVTLNSESPVIALKKMLGIEEFRRTAAADVWYDASAEKVAAGGVFVRVASVTIESLATAVGREAASAAGLETAEKYLFVELRLENQSAKMTADYLSWSDGIDSGEAVPLLTDDRGTKYKAVSFGKFRLPGQTGRTSIAPGGAATDLLAFERPADQFAALRLSLPLLVFHEQGSIQFDIPHTMVVRATYSPPAPEDAPTTTPADETARPAPSPKREKRNPLETIEITSEPEDGSEGQESRVEGQEPEPD